MNYKLGKDGWPTDETVIDARDTEIESQSATIASLRQQVRELTELLNCVKAERAQQGEPVTRYFEQYSGQPIEEIDAARFAETPEDSRFKLYTSAPTVPKALDRSCDEHNDACWAYQDGWNQCRKAMLSAPKGEKE